MNPAFPVRASLPERTLARTDPRPLLAMAGRRLYPKKVRGAGRDEMAAAGAGVTRAAMSRFRC